MSVEFTIEFPREHVDLRVPREGSVDSLYREGFRDSFDMQKYMCLLERWDHPDHRYKLVAYKGGGIFMAEDVNDAQWKEIVDLIFGQDEPPVPLVSEDWFELEIISDPAHAPLGGTHVRRLSCDEIPATITEWRKFAGRFAREHEQTFILRNGRSGEVLFSDILQADREGYVKVIARERPKNSG